MRLSLASSKCLSAAALISGYDMCDAREETLLALLLPLLFGLLLETTNDGGRLMR